jgi:hypothetical protein
MRLTVVQGMVAHETRNRIAGFATEHESHLLSISIDLSHGMSLEEGSTIHVHRQTSRIEYTRAFVDSR